MKSVSEMYFGGEISSGFKYLVTGRTVMLIASGLLGLFLPVFLFKLFDYSFQMVVVFYGITSALYVLFLPFGVRVLDEKLGLKKSMQLSMIFLASFYVLLSFVDSETVKIYIPLALIALTLFRLSFWIPFFTDISKLTDSKKRGREMSWISAIQMFLSVVLPIVAALIIDAYGFTILFIMAIVLYLLTMIPFSRIPHTREDFQWSWAHTWNIIIDAFRSKKVLHAYVANGAETFVGLIIWPVYIFELLNGNFLEVGIISALIVLVTIVLQLMSGKYIDTKISKQKLLQVGSILYAVGWLFKIFVITAFQIFIAGTYHNITKIFIQTPFDTMNFDMSADEGHYVDEFSVITQMATHIGRLLMALIVFVMLFFVSIQWTFAIAAFCSILFNFISANDFHLKKV